MCFFKLNKININIKNCTLKLHFLNKYIKKLIKVIYFRNNNQIHFFHDIFENFLQKQMIFYLITFLI